MTAYYDKNTPDLEATGWKVGYTNMTLKPTVVRTYVVCGTAVPND